MKHLILAALLAGTSLVTPTAIQAETAQYIPLPTYRTGPYASSGE